MYFEVSKTHRQKKNLINRIGVIKYKKSTIRNQSIIQIFFSSMGPQRGDMNKQHV
jgi:acetolactate synthase small subunit